MRYVFEHCRRERKARNGSFLTMILDDFGNLLYRVIVVSEKTNF